MHGDESDAPVRETADTAPFPAAPAAWQQPAETVPQPRPPAGPAPTGEYPGVPTYPAQTGQFPPAQTGQFLPASGWPHLGRPTTAVPPIVAPQIPRQPYPAPPQYQPQYAPPYPPPHPPFGPPYGQQLPPPKPSRITVLRVALLVALALILVTPPAAVAFETVRRDRADAAETQGADPSGRPAGESKGGAGASPTKSQAKTTPPATVDGRVKQVLAEQGAALLAGDSAGFVAPVDPSVPKLRDDLSRRYNSLRQLQVKVWEPVILDKVQVAGDGTASVTVYVRYCFVVETCDAMNLQTRTKWNVAGAETKLLEFGVADELGPRPWEVSDLRTAVGKRVVLATTAKYASRLPGMLSAAEKAAELTDRYAKWDPPPSRYVVYLAGPDEWSSWYGIKQESWVAGFALPLTPNATEIVLNASRVDAKESLDVLRHEFTHVVTLANVSRAYDNTWWLVEGIAEYVRVKGGGKAFDGTADVRKYVQSGHWKNEIALNDPPEGSTTADVSGRYGVAYLAVNRMAERFGEDKMLEFFNLTARQGVPLQDAATKVYGVSWDDVATDCAKHVRSQI